jgi:hypothetical protein
MARELRTSWFRVCRSRYRAGQLGFPPINRFINAVLVGPLSVVRRVLRAQIGILPRHLLAIVRVCDAKVASAKIIVCGALQVGATVKAVGYGWCHLSGR